MLECIMTSRDDQPKGIDFEAMEAAFKRAAYRAVHGTREERSGRFLPDRQHDALKPGGENPSDPPSVAETDKPKPPPS
jgi:hypothetical protein